MLGETRVLPLGLGTSRGAAVLLRHAVGAGWPHAGGFILLAGVVLLLVVSVSLTARDRR